VPVSSRRSKHESPLVRKHESPLVRSTAMVRSGEGGFTADTLIPIIALIITALIFGTAGLRLHRLSLSEFNPFETSGWHDTPEQRERWKQLQFAFLRSTDLPLRCGYCGAAPLRIYDWCSMASGRGQSDMATADHVVPRSKGGANHPANMVVVCYQCTTM
jgi:hypothetical protein